ncbi:unnamed protein product, partial [Mesorhabditis belari]|uniref:EB domain-containing protein n=1 Tax=Mesorhabditis belari TaxID=2138241 RepID=A0AAF3EE80_9BILA
MQILYVNSVFEIEKIEHLIDSHFFKESLTLGRVCASDSDCAAVLHAECRNSICECTSDHFAHPHKNDLCQSASTFGEECSEILPCKSPFDCFDEKCICAESFVHHQNTCIKKCAKGEIAITEWNHQCVKLRGLGEECAYDEQCWTRFSECAAQRCTCRRGMRNQNDTCIATPYCPFGPAPLMNNEVIDCRLDQGAQCPKGLYCQQYHFIRNQGFCCPIAEAFCPIGFPHPTADCTNCPYDTHSCYTFNVGMKQQSLCCPTDCHRSSLVRDGDRCLPLVPLGGECYQNAQCDILLPGAICENGFCTCPSQMMVKNGKCFPLSPLNGECLSHSECREESQLRCVNGRCVCATEHVPEPFVDEPKRCIPAATCPTSAGLFKKLFTFSECNDVVKCAENEYCRKWWQDERSNQSYSLCCPKPGVHEFNTVCGRFGMSLVLTNSIDTLASPLPCGLHPIQGHSDCPDGSACVFNPFSIGDGICCRTLRQLNNKTF